MWECGEIGRHDGLKIRCLVISVRVQVPPFPIIRIIIKNSIKIYIFTLQIISYINLVFIIFNNVKVLKIIIIIVH